jgi:hypothetical protein
MTAEKLQKHMNELARQFPRTHDKELKPALEALRGRVAAMKRRLI